MKNNSWLQEENGLAPTTNFSTDLTLLLYIIFTINRWLCLVFSFFLSYNFTQKHNWLSCSINLSKPNPIIHKSEQKLNATCESRCLRYIIHNHFWFGIFVKYNVVCVCAFSMFYTWWIWMSLVYCICDWYLCVQITLLERNLIIILKM